MIQGLLLIDKPEAWTSFDAVNYVRKIVATIEDKKPKNVRVGHTGTLDPFATGLLILLIGKDYTKRAGEFSKQDKVYRVNMVLGQISSTGDPEGEISKESDVSPQKEDIEKTMSGFIGKISQTPPAYSAVKVNGQRAYKLARGGKDFVIEAREVTVHELELENYKYPNVVFRVDASSGTYIRSLVSDIGEKLGTGAYTSELKRLSINGYSVDQAVRPKQLNQENIEQFVKEV